MRLLTVLPDEDSDPHVESRTHFITCRKYGAGGREGLKEIKSLPIGIEGFFMSKMQLFPRVILVVAVECNVALQWSVGRVIKLLVTVSYLLQ